jgi:hypothetical protein
MISLECVVKQSYVEEQTGPVEVADNLFCALSFCRQRVVS